MPSWTREQEKAIKARGSNLLVAAAAGSGKTAVLVERILQLIINDGVDIDKLLIVTFTNAAAGEMRERIAHAITKELESNSLKEVHIRRQLTLLSKASIMTLHAFCIEVVKKHFHFIDVDPAFRIGDTTEITIMQMEALEELFEEAYKKADPLFLELVEAYGGSREDLPLQNLILTIYGFIQSQPYPIKWLEEKVADFQLSFEALEDSLWMKTIRESIDVRIKEALLLLQEAKELCGRPYGPVAYLNAIDNDISMLQQLIFSLDEGTKQFYEVIKELKHQNLKPVGKDCNEAYKEEAKALRDQAKDIIKKLQEDYFALAPEDYYKDIKYLHPLMLELSRLIVAFSESFRGKKLEKGIVDFNDLEHFALEILQQPKVAEEYRERFEYIFIDEYQDSNIVQETIINSIKKRDNLFMVGDVKQSIYRFRLADPTLFIEKYEAFTEDGVNRRIDLSKNFRSRGEILAGVNYLFKNLMTKYLGEIDYTKEAYLYLGGEFKPLDSNEIQLTIIEKNYSMEEELEDEIEELEDIEVEAKIVSAQIKRLLEEKIYDAKLEEYRDIDFKDIVILLRTTSNWAPVFHETLVKEGIPTYADANTGYFQSLEISLFMNFLRVIDNKRQDIPLLSLMRSPIGGFSVEELIDIRLSNRRGSFYEAVFHYCEVKADKLQEKLKTFISKLDKWAEAARYMKLDEFIWKLFMESGYYHYIGAMPGGIQRQANLRVLMDRATQFQKTSIKGLFNFILFIEKLKNSKGDMGSAKILSENDNVVRIMSIHKSKGLEFPVVIVAGMGKHFNLTDVNNPILLHKNLGLGPNFVDIEKRFYRDTIAKLAMKERIKLESLSEELRVLYVALTRPKDKLILVASVKNLERQCKKWSRGLSTLNLINGKCYLDWIGSALIKHPDGEVLRRLANIDDGQVFSDEDSSWVINVTDRRELAMEKRAADLKKEEYKNKLTSCKVNSSENYKALIHERLEWQYPHQQALNIPSKISVTEIKQGQYKKIEELGYKIPPLVKLPKFIEGSKEFSAAEKGTILHFVLQHLNLEEVKTLEQIQLQLDLMVEKELLTSLEAQVVDIQKILGFFTNKVGRRMLGAKKVYREVPFNLRKTAAEVIESLKDCHEELLIQGVIDCYFEEDSSLVLLDYKSDFVIEGNTDMIIKKYKPQLDLYQEALERITGKTVKERILYLFSIDLDLTI